MCRTYAYGEVYPLGAAGSYAAISLVFVHGYKLATGKTGMGEGDPKFVAMIGAFLGLEGAMFALFAGAFQGLIIGTMLVLYRRRTRTEPAPPLLDEELDEHGEEADPDSRLRKARVPFGPFLALGAIEYYLAGPWLLERYLDTVARLFSFALH